MTPRVETEIPRGADLLDEPVSAPDLLRPEGPLGVNLTRPLMVAALVVALIMVPVGGFLAVLGVFVLEMSGGAATDTSIVIAIAAITVTDFWGGGLLAGRMSAATARDIAAAWAIVRLVLLIVIALVLTNLLIAIPVQLILALGAAWAGARFGKKHAAIQRAVAREVAAADEEFAGPAPGRSHGTRQSEPLL